MTSPIRSPRRPLLAALLLLGLWPTLGAADEPLERRALDEQLHRTLRDVINRGAEMYNRGDPAACAGMFRGALMTVQPLLGHHPDTQKAVDAALAEADRTPDPRRRAWVLRRSLDDVRAALGGAAKPAVAEKSLWERLGGEAGVSKVVDDWVALLAEDPKANFFRDGKIKLTDEQVAALKKMAVAWVSQQSGGPLKYTGKSMKEVHKDMAITDAEFDATVTALVEALKKNDVKPEDIAAVKGAVEKTRKDIVEAKKDDDKKDEGK